VDPFFLAALVVLALLGALWLHASRSDRSLERLRDLTGATDASPAAIEARVASLVETAASSDARLAAGAANLASIVSELPIGVLRVDDDLVVRVANPAAHLIADRDAGTMVGRSLIEAFVESRVEEIASVARVVGSANGEVTTRGLEPRSLLVDARRVPSGDLWVMVQDVSELRRLERIRAEFVDNLSHELRTPLTNVSLLSQTLARQADAAGAAIDPKMRDRIARIEVETGHLVQMVNELLDLARIEGGGVTALVDEIDMAAVARASIERMRAFADQQAVELVVEASEALPAVRGDGDRVAQVLLNLLHNAIKFSTSGGRVTVRIETEGRQVVTSVEDHGIGIRHADQARIFERFYKVDRARVRGGGTGLGLAIARHIVDAHGGRIGVRSHEGSGSTFWFSLPAESETTFGPDAGWAASIGGPIMPLPGARETPTTAG
jgi:two-component system phosphate regulon sensor histidine kinase PhoR